MIKKKNFFSFSYEHKKMSQCNSLIVLCIWHSFKYVGFGYKSKLCENEAPRES